jgi:hypothetical protein
LRNRRRPQVQPTRTFADDDRFRCTSSLPTRPTKCNRFIGGMSARFISTTALRTFYRTFF